MRTTRTKLTKTNYLYRFIALVSVFDSMGLCVSSVYSWNHANRTDLRWNTTTEKSGRRWCPSPRWTERRWRTTMLWEVEDSDCRSSCRSAAPLRRDRHADPRGRIYNAGYFRCVARETLQSLSVSSAQNHTTALWFLLFILIVFFCVLLHLLFAATYIHNSNYHLLPREQFNVI